MNLNLKPEHKAFADEVRAFARANLSPATKDKTFSGKHYDRDDHMAWQQALGRQGWLAYTWPKKYGGPGWDVTQRFLFENVLAEEGAPRIIPFGVKMVGPVIYTFGSDEQKERFLPGIRQSTVSWCQGYSEPGAGSDLANLRTRAVREGDHYIVNGQKTWTSFAHWGDWIFCLVRTNPDAKPQEGISFLLVDMKTPGISVEPIITADGNRAGTQEVNSVFFTDVKVPVENRVGEENKGWTYAKYLLEFERGGNPYSPRLRSAFERLKKLSQAMPDGEDSIMADVSWREKLARMDIEISGLEMFEQEFYSRLASGQNPGPLSSMIKLRGTEVMQQVQESAVEAAGYYSQPFPEQRAWNANVEPIGPEGVDVLAPRYFNGRKMTIYGGSSEVQRGIMSKVMLGL